MPDNIIRYKLLISCPSDVKEEIDIIENCVENFNNEHKDHDGVLIETVHWSKNSHPESGAKPQTILNEQIVKKCDAAVAIFRTRFGTPTDKYGSGTEEEIEIMLQDHKKVFLYILDYSPSDEQKEEYHKIQDFKERYSKKGLYGTYQSMEEFKSSFCLLLRDEFLKKETVEQITHTETVEQITRSETVEQITRAKSQLVLRGIVGTQVTEKARLVLLTFASSIYGFIEEEIRKLFSQIKNYEIILSPAIQENNLNFLINENPPSKVVFGNEEKTIITKHVKEVLKESLDEDFFDLGNLCMRENSFSIPGFGNKYKLIGSDEEKEKRKLLYDMYNLICEKNNLIPILEFYKSHPGIRLAVANIGSSVDEDIHITLKFPKGSIVSLKHLPIPADFILEFINEDIDELFGIPKTPNYEEYPFRYSFLSPMSVSVPMWNNNHHSDLVNMYSSKLEYLFHYEFFQEGNDDIIQLEYQSINHNFAFAFPSILFLSRTIDSIEYTIRSRHNPEIVKGALAIEIDESLKTKEIQDL